MLSEILEISGYQTLEADGVATGIACAQKNGPDLILCDVMLQDGTGFDILAALQKHPRLQMVPFIFISGEAVTPTDIRKGMLKGADDYLLKPFKIPELLEAVQARLERVHRLAGSASHILPECFAGSHEALKPWIEQLNIQSCPYLLLAVSLHRFERFSHLFGWQEADQVVETLVKRLLKRFDSSAPAVFLSHEPDKFYLLWQTPIQPRNAREIANDVIDDLTQAQLWNDHVLHLNAQIGIVTSPDRDALVHADLALDQAKAEGAGSIVFFEEGMDQPFKLNFRWEQELALALEKNYFEVFYQPQFDIKTCQMTGVEALIRLRHPRLGLVSPATFIPIAEECDLIVPIGQWVLETACQQICQWQSEYGFLLRLAVNVSMKQFHQTNFVDRVAETLSNTGMPSHNLEIELTESLLSKEPTQTLLQLKALKALGLTLAMDDFGTGYSSLASLSQMPFDVLKIDQSFVRGLSDHKKHAIPYAITEMGHSLGLTVLAEGVETKDQLELLQSMGCDLGQGFWYARPMPAEELPLFWQSKQELAEL